MRYQVQVDSHSPAPPTLFLADTLPIFYPNFYKGFEASLQHCQVQVAWIQHTKDVWCKDYMPIKNQAQQLIQFRYHPSYLKGQRKYQSNPDELQFKVDLPILPSPLVIDGGNLSLTHNKAIVCDHVLSENPHLSRQELLNSLRTTLQLDEIILIPTHRDDFTGHSDGIIRFLNEHTVLINDYSSGDGYSQQYMQELLQVLKKNKISAIPLTYHPWQNKLASSAKGEYINYFELEENIFLPVFKLKSDEQAFQCLQEIFPHKRIHPIPCNELARGGGLLNCITWVN
jgi:agmatine/peptidylarginine deiminase